MAEAERKRAAAREAAEADGYDALVASSAPTVRWLLCGRGRPVDAASPDATYIAVVADGRAYVLTANIEAPRAAAEERFEELGYELVAYPWSEGPARVLAELTRGRRAVSDRKVEGALAPRRRTLSESERDRYRRAGADAAEAMAATIGRLSRTMRELDAAAELAREVRARGFFPPVVLVAGEQRQPIHRHPVPTDAPLGRHTLLAVTAERDGLHVSLTRLIAFERPPAALVSLVRATAEIDAVVLSASQPGRTLGGVFDELARAYAERGYAEEWRHHHQGGLTGYRGREIFAAPDEPTTIPESAAVAWNPSITGGAKSEDTALVTADGVEVLTRTPDLPEFDLRGVPRPSIVEV